MIICVYALVSLPRRSGSAKAERAPARLALTGMTGETLRLVTVNRITAVVGDLRRPPAPGVRNLRRYAAVIISLAARTSAILPARFATTARDAAELTFILQSRSTTLRQRLKSVRHRTQMTIRLLESESGDAPFASQTRVTGRTRLRLANGASQGTQYLKRRMEIAKRAAAVPAFEPVRAAVRRYIKDERVEKRQGVVTINHLIPRTAAARYQAAVARAARDNELRLIVSGPWPPFAFADSW